MNKVDMESKYLKGRIAISLTQVYTKENRSRDYRIVFWKERVRIASIFHHPATGSYCLEGVADVVLTPETLIRLMEMMNVRTFRRNRRRLQSQYRRNRKCTNS